LLQQHFTNYNKKYLRHAIFYDYLGKSWLVITKTI